MTVLGMKTEFEKAFESELDKYEPAGPWSVALWAAKWMAEYIADLPDTNNFYEIRQLAKELQ